MPATNRPQQPRQRSPRGERSASKPAPAAPKPLWIYIGAGVGLIVVVLCLVFGAVYLYATNRPALATGQSKTFVIPHDTSWPGVVKILRQERLVRSRWSFELWARRRGLPAKVKAGVYTWSGPVSLDEMAERLAQGGKTQDVTLTILEGWTIYHVADRLESVGLVSRTAFLDAVCDPALLSELDVPGECAEGYLFPDTYRVAQGTSAEQIVRKLHAQWRSKWEQLEAQEPDALKALKDLYDLSKHDAVILASLVERETNHDPERATIARVFLNRLEKKMRLQTDPTCVYGARTYKEIPQPKYCKDKLNRYSTYVIDGLPPGPIGAPSLESLRAALRPSQESKSFKYLFFVARRDGSGSHYFTSTFAEHKKAIDRYLR